MVHGSGLGIGVLLALLLGLASWHLVEKHGLRLRTALTDSPPRPEQPTERIPALRLSEAPTIEMPAFRQVTPQVSGRPPTR